ncbi:heavy-metal-associated domain-containing protein [Rothia sp. P7181]|uniref:heavy-metal-associated domain-containing protein n=1 Tax=unclassified Rothia (in: high G+C Gram-positive bacteria) TaxID=2689056 RepID=UPI003ACC373F
MTETIVKATGLTCNHCAMSVEEELKELSEVQEVNVDVVKDGESTVTISHEEELSRDKIREAIAEAGFTLVD